MPILRTIDSLIDSLSLTGRLVLYILGALFIASGVGLVWNVNNAFMVEVPQTGGTLVEGVIGLPRFINPVLSVTDADKDLTSLVYSGLLRAMPDNTFALDLADSYKISEDGKMYTFILRPNAVFHDGHAVTADDVVFTVQKIQDPAIKSNKRAHWEGVTVEKVSENEVRFILQQPYAPFIENTTIGILPKHLWDSPEAESFATSSYNTQPIGSGPFMFKSVEQNENNVPTSYTLAPFKEYTLGKPFISSFVVTFYTSERDLVEAYLKGDIAHINSISPEVAELLKEKNAVIEEAALPRIFALFFNQSNNRALAQKEVRRALSQSVDRQHVVDVVLRGFGNPLDSAVPKSFTSEVQSDQSDSSQESADRTNAAITLLEQNGWKLNAQGIREKKIGKDTIPLSFSISTSDAPELKEAAELISAEWQKLGANVSIKIFEGGYLNQDIIKPRKYDALLFGQVINRDLDLFAFWHSTQTEDPGLNVSLFSNKDADSLLEKMRVTSDKLLREDLYRQLEVTLNEDIPAVFLYSPHFIYVISPKINGIALDELSVPSDRFGNVFNWYIATEKVWNIFVKN